MEALQELVSKYGSLLSEFNKWIERNKTRNHAAQEDDLIQESENVLTTLKRKPSDSANDNGSPSHRRKSRRTNTSHNAYKVKEHFWLDTTPDNRIGQIMNITGDIKRLENIIDDLKNRPEGLLNFKIHLLGWGAEGSDTESDGFWITSDHCTRKMGDKGGFWPHNSGFIGIYHYLELLYSIALLYKTMISGSSLSGRKWGCGLLFQAII